MLLGDGDEVAKESRDPVGPNVCENSDCCVGSSLKKKDLVLDKGAKI